MYLCVLSASVVFLFLVYKEIRNSLKSLRNSLKSLRDSLKLHHNSLKTLRNILKSLPNSLKSPPYSLKSIRNSLKPFPNSFKLHPDILKRYSQNIISILKSKAIFNKVIGKYLGSFKTPYYKSFQFYHAIRPWIYFYFPLYTPSLQKKQVG